MFRLFTIKKSTVNQFTREDLKIVKDYLDECKDLPYKIDWTGVSFYWCPELTQYGYKGAFVPYHPKTIFIKPVSDPRVSIKHKDNPNIVADAQNMYEGNIKEIVPVIVHEGTHCQQYHQNDNKGWYKKIYTHRRYNLISSIRPLYNIKLDGIAFENEIFCAVSLGLDRNLYGKPL